MFNPLLTPARQQDLVDFGSMGLPYNSRDFINDKPMARKQILDILKNIYQKGLNFSLSGGYGAGHTSPEHTAYGTAIDMVPSGNTQYDDLVKALNSSGLKTLVHDAGSGKHIHAQPGQYLLDEYSQNNSQPKQEAKKNMNYMNAAMPLQMKELSLESPDMTNLNKSIYTPFTNFPTQATPSMPQPNNYMNLGAQQKKEPRDMTPLQLALILTGQTIANQGKGADFTPLTNYLTQKKLLSTKQKEEESKAYKEGIEATNYIAALKQMGMNIPEGVTDLKSAQELGELNFKLREAKSTEEYRNTSLALQEKELQHKIKGETGVKNIFAGSKDPGLIMMSILNDPQSLQQLSPQTQQDMRSYLDTKIKTPSSIFEQEQAKKQGGITGQMEGRYNIGDVEALKAQASASGKIQGEVGGSKTVADVEAEKGRGKNLAESQQAYSLMTSKMPSLEKTVTELDKLSKAATYTKAGRFTNEFKRQLGIDVGDAGVARKQYQSMVNNQILPLLRQTFGAQFTEKEGQTLRETLGDVNASPREKQAVLKSFIQQKRRDIEDAGRQIQTQGGRLPSVPQAPKLNNTGWAF